MPIQFRRGEESELSAADLLAGEPAFTTDTHKLFVSDGEAVHSLAMSADLTAHDGSASAHAARFNNKLDKSGGSISGNLSVLGNLLVGANGGKSVWTAGTLPVESGTWTPTLPSGYAINAGITTCYYYRIGNLCYVSGKITLSAIPASTTDFKVTNLPFRPSASLGTAVMQRYVGINKASIYRPSGSGELSENSASMFFFVHDGKDDRSYYLNSAMMTATMWFTFGAIYSC